MIMPKISDRLLPFEDKPDKVFMGLQFYLDLARKSIITFAKKNIQKKLLDDEDYVSFIAFRLMMIDYSYNEKYSEDPQKQASLNSYRYICISREIRKFRKFKTANDSKMINFTDLDQQLPDDKYRNFEPIDCPKYDIARFQGKIDTLIKLCNLKPRHASILSSYFISDRTLEDIAADYCITKQAVHSIILRALEKIRTVGKKSFVQEEMYGD